MTDTPSDLELHLRYAHGTGALAPYFEALASGNALASKCGICGRVWFPPHIHCPDDGGVCDWLTLDGAGEVVSATTTRSRLPFADQAEDHVFVLVAMDGADNAAFGRMRPDTDGERLVGCRVRLVGAPEAPPHPAQAALFEVLEET